MSASRVPDLTEDDLIYLRRLRHDIRLGEGSGGMCSLVVEVAMERFGGDGISGVYVNAEDEPLIDHTWLRLADGTVLDATADQIGVGLDIAFIRPGEPGYERYRWEWTADYNPGRDDCPDLHGVAWTGEYDEDRMSRLRAERGRHWWVTDRAGFEAYEQACRLYESGGNPLPELGTLEPDDAGSVLRFPG